MRISSISGTYSTRCSLRGEEGGGGAPTPTAWSLLGPTTDPATPPGNNGVSLTSGRTFSGEHSLKQELNYYQLEKKAKSKYS